MSEGMQEIIIDDIEQLKSFIDQCGDGYLFRGQTGNYLNENKKISIPTSFKRHGCIPPLMFKWTHYSKALIRSFGGGCYHDLDFGVSQAILQHYGWRSFFIDLSKDAHIACWFAANNYSEDKRVHMCEDFEENPVWLVHKEASYSESDDYGHVYVIDEKYFLDNNIKIHDLTKLAGTEGRLRFQAQSACLVEGVDGVLPQDSIAAHLTVNHEVLVKYFESKGVKTTLDVFPDRKSDYILKCLLDLPWNEIQSNSDFPIPAYRRGLEIPEYDSKFMKHLPPSVTLFSPFWISEERQGDDSPFAKIPFYKISEHAYFSNTNEQFDLTEVNKILVEHAGFAIELDGLINIPELGDSYEYEKGILVEKVDSDTFTVSGLVVEHPGHKVSVVGANQGWFYKVNGGIWKRTIHVDQCPCNNDLRHELQFSLLRVLNESLKECVIICEDKLNFHHKDLKDF
jgi:hypothetical protein